MWNHRVTAAAVCLPLAAGLFLRLNITAQAPPSVYANFEGAQTNPIRLSPDGTRLFAVNTGNASLSVFDVTQPASPKLLEEIPVGLEPVSVNPVSNNVAWVVNQVSDSISIVSVSQGIVTGTINLKALSTTAQPLPEPMDVVFAGGRAYVSVSRANAIAVFDMKSPDKLLANIPVFGDNPRAMAVSPDGSLVYAAFALSGNGTTIIPSTAAPPQPPPTNPSLPPPPQVGLIVAANDPAWSQDIPFTMPDNDVVAISTGAKPAVSGYYSHLGTINLGLAVNPVTGDLFVANTDALNLTHFETNLLGHFVNNRVTRVQVSSGQATAFDLNPGIDYSNLPSSAALASALAQPTAEVFDPSGAFLYVAAFGTDRVAKVDTNGNVISFVEVSPPSGSGSNVDPANKRGPRGLALSADARTLYSLNRISNTISIVNTPQNSVSSEIAVGTDNTPAAIRQGRGFLYDAKLSGSGTGSCASCHIDGDMDHLDWDLGDPSGAMTSTVQNGIQINFHPMKGPLFTQTLRGLLGLAPYHWRGDKPDFAAFNAAFPGLMGAPSISTADMQAYTNYIDTLLFLPNPYQNLDRSLPASLRGGDPVKGENIFLTARLANNNGTCNDCHTSNPGPGTNLKIRPNNKSGQPLKNPQLRNIYQKLLFTKHNTTTIDGFGLVRDGSLDSIIGFLNGDFPRYSHAQKVAMASYEFCADTGTAPAVGYARTLTAANVTGAPEQSDWTTLQARAAAGDIDLVVRGTIQGTVHGLLYQVSAANYISDTGAIFTQAQLQSLIQAGDTLTVMGVYPGSGSASPLVARR